MRRRRVLAAAAALPLLPLAACDAPRAIDGRFTGIDVARGHALRDRLVSGTSSAVPSIVKRCRVVIAGGGIAGLAAARALRLNGIEDFVLLEMEDSAGGNSRGGTVNGIACPLGAHYLPVPGDDASEVQDLLEELGLRQRVSGRWVYDEATLCHSPQERLFFQGAWQEGLLPMQGVSDATLAQYRRFESAVSALQREARFTIPTLKSPFTPLLRSLDATPFAAWLDANGLVDPLLRGYLDYCCRDDYGAGAKSVSAWAGLHYFAARHGFHAPGSPADASDDAVLTWPEGNGWLSGRLAAPLGDRLHTGCAVQRITELRHGVEVDAWDEGRHEWVRWQAESCVVALPVFIAARVVGNPTDFLRSA
ncbi:MAG: amine oxidase, partial [Rhizobacter sp.]|nr:amine oxidase [Rhizobacter sp.]